MRVEVTTMDKAISNEAESADSTGLKATVNAHFIISGYIEHAMAQAEYENLEDGSFGGRIPPCNGVIAFGSTLHECETELRSTLEDWLLVGFRLGQLLPVVDGIDLNGEPAYEPVDAV
jgi:predicted RNase H-like HicB family nuclease